MDDQDLPPPHTTTYQTSDNQTPPIDNQPTSVQSQHEQKIDQFISLLDSNDQSPPPEIIDPVHNFADLLDVKIAEYESGSKNWIQLEEDESSSFSFIESVDRTSKLLKSLSKFHSNENYVTAVNRISGIQQRAMSIIEDEYKSILDDYQTSYDRDQSNKIEEAKTKQLSVSVSNVGESSPETDLPDQSDQSEAVKDEFLGYSDEMISKLNKLVYGLIRGGHETECSEIYLFVRRNAIEQTLKQLSFEKYSIDEMQKLQWEPIEKEVVSWMNLFKLFCSSLLPSERKLADAVFSNYSAVADSLFSKLARIVLLYFLGFAEAVMMMKRSSDKLFKFLDIYQTLRDIIPQLEKLLSDVYMNPVRSAVSLINTVLGESIYSIFIELENSIKADSAKTAVPGGAVHPLTRYTMNYLKYACEYSNTLEQVFKEHRRIDRADSETDPGSEHDSSFQDNETPFRSQLVKIMDLLDANLETKSRLYRDNSLSLIFMMNNGRYILQKTKGTGEMRTLMGDSWVRRRSSDIRSYHTNYKRETWTRLLNCLSHEGLSVNGKVMKPVLKERFKSFNAMFDDIYRTQTTWVVSDEQLQSELRVSISAIVIPAYRSFMGRFSQVFTAGRQTEKYIKYQPEDIETCIEELFDGSAAQSSKKR
ncbi:exocyst complex component EXO70C2-like [Rutidosis leptorrhynchoides]|uniref:exocyst complex component EXO70C2-like n=1 Tax=Rutidosis leptorrhynchoides TaxID=125765 RepID=UPI003A98CED7